MFSRQIGGPPSIALYRHPDDGTYVIEFRTAATMTATDAGAPRLC
jgi:hypothetical protein